MRLKIREQNRKNKDFRHLFVDHATFSIKDFVRYDLEKLFDTNKARALGGG